MAFCPINLLLVISDASSLQQLVTPSPPFTPRRSLFPCFLILSKVYFLTEIITKMAHFFSALEFLSTKAKVIHGDLLINNILINRVWNYEPGCSPSKLCHLATSKANMAPDVSDLGFYNNTMSQSGLGSNAGAIMQSLDISAPVGPCSCSCC
jgi:hypothetical protein